MTFSWIWETIGGFIIGVFCTEIWKRSRKLIVKKKLKKINPPSQYRNEKQSYEFIFLDHAIPKYFRNNIDIKNTNKSFFWGVSEKKKQEFRNYKNKFVLRDAVAIDQNKPLYDFIKNNYPNIKDIEPFLNEISDKTADMFLNGLSGGKTLFNNRMFGIYHISTNRGDGDDENSTLDLEVFTTDYFTYKFMVNVYTALVSIKDVFKIEIAADINKYLPFFCSIGIGGFLIINRFGEDELLWTKRSKGVACPDLWHFSYDETFSIKDCVNRRTSNGEEQKPNVYECLERGIMEELGIGGRDETYGVDDYGIVDIGVIKNNNRLEFEILSYAQILLKNKDFTNDDFIEFTKIAQDGQLESIEMEGIPIKDTKAFFNDRNKKFTPESKALYSAIKIRIKGGLINTIKNF